MLKELQEISNVLLYFNNQKNELIFSEQEVAVLSTTLNQAMAIQDHLNKSLEKLSLAYLNDADEIINLLIMAHQSFSQLISLIDRLHALMTKVIRYD